MAQFLTVFAFLLVIAFTILIYALPLVPALLFLAICGWCFWRGKRAELAMMLASFLIGFAAIEIYVRYNADELFYREHEKWALSGHYRPHVTDDVQIQYGDMVAMDRKLKEQLAEPHRINFKTDSLGYRNDADYAGEPFVLLGDSFTAGVGNDQEETLVAQLNRAHPKQYYSLGYPGNPLDYENTAERFMYFTKVKPRYLWFVFEGNDFVPPEEKSDKPKHYKPWKEYQAFFSSRTMPFLGTRFLMLLYKAAGFHSHAKKGVAPVEVQDIDGKSMGFLTNYIQATEAEKLEFRTLGAPAVLENTACVFFIPEKTRVYKPWLKEVKVYEPAAGLAALKEYFGPHHIPVVDLTPELAAAAKKELAGGKFVFWRGDSHWNGLGMASVTAAVERCAAQSLHK